MDPLNILLMLGAILAATAVSALCAVGLIVWLAGGKTGRWKDGKKA